MDNPKKKVLSPDEFRAYMQDTMAFCREGFAALSPAVMLDSEAIQSQGPDRSTMDDPKNTDLGPAEFRAYMKNTMAFCREGFAALSPAMKLNTDAIQRQGLQPTNVRSDVESQGLALAEQVTYNQETRRILLAKHNEDFSKLREELFAQKKATGVKSYAPYVKDGIVMVYKKSEKAWGPCGRCKGVKFCKTHESMIG